VECPFLADTRIATGALALRTCLTVESSREAK
jgi:hypothetical protein